MTRAHARWFPVLAAALLLTVRVSLPGTSPASAVAPAGAAPAPAATAMARLTGLVLSPEGGSPVKGALVEAFARLDTAGQRANRAAGQFVPDPVATAVTDGSGRFDLRLDPGVRVVVSARAPGFAADRFAPLTTPDAGEPPRDLGRLELDTGRRLEGRVVDPDGRPVAGARVAALAAAMRGGRRGGSMGPRAGGMRLDAGQFVGFARTGADGSFSLDSLPQRSITLRVYAAGFAPAMMAEPRGGARLSVTMSRGHEVSGVVMAPDGRPASAAWVLVGDDGLDGVARADAQGRFRLERVAPGARTLVATGADILIPQGKSDSPTITASWAPSSPLRLTVPAAAGDKPPRLTLRPGAVVRARAVDAVTRAPLDGALLALDEPGDQAPRVAVAGDRGEAIFTGVPAGGSVLRASAEGYLDEVNGPRALRAGDNEPITAALTAAASLEGTVRDPAGRAVAGARVSLATSPPIAAPVPIPIFIPLGEPAVTDEQGRWSLPRLPSDRPMRLRVEHDGFATWEMTDLRLRPGEKRSGVDAWLDAGLLITGRLLGPDREPVAGAALTASRAQEGSAMGGVSIRIATGGGPGRRGRDQVFGGGDALPETTTSSDGVFRVRGARPGIWSLDIRARGFAPKSVAGLKMEESARTLDAGDIVLDRGAAVRGRVVDAAGQPIPYARGMMRRELSTFAETLAGPDGIFALEDLQPGAAVTMQFTAEGYGDVEKGGVVPPVDDLVVTLPAASRLSGQVLDQETRRPVEDYTVSVTRQRSMSGGGMSIMSVGQGPEQAVHAEDGSFTVDGVAPGRVVVTVRAPGYKEAVLRDVEVAEGKDVDGLQFLLDRAVSVSGVVVDDEGKPLPGVSVSRSESSGRGMIRLGPILGGDNETDGDGRFVVEGLDRGMVTLSFTHPQYEPTERDVDASRDVENLRVAMTRGASLTGIVLRDEDGSPVASATVLAQSAGSGMMGGSLSARTGPDGAFQIDTVRPGRWLLSASATGLRARGEPQEIVVASGTPVPPVELRLGGGVTLTGTVTGVKEDELPRMTVTAVAPGSAGFGAGAAVDAAGRFEIKGLPSGTLTLRAGSSMLGGRSITRTVQIPEGAATFETTIEFPRGRKVEGVVTRAGQPLDGANVIFSMEGFRSSASDTTDSAGRYTLEDLDDGEYTVNVMHFSSGASHSTKLSVNADRTFDIELPTARLTGTVTDAGSGRPLDGTTVSIDREGGRPAGGFMFMTQNRTDATGAFRFDGLGDGTYTITVRRDGYAVQTRTVRIVPSVEPDPVSFELTRTEGLTFRALDARSGMALSRIEALVLTPAASDPLATPAAAPLYRGELAADASGVFHLDALGPGAYTLVLGGQAVATRTLSVTVPAPEATWSLEPGGNLEIRIASLADAQTARGVLTDAAGAVAHWQLFTPDPTFTVRTGSPTVVRDLPAGRYRLRLLMPGGSVAERNVEIAPGATAVLAIN